MREEKPKYNRFFLKNGLEVILVERPERYTAVLSGYFRAGSAYENRKISGASHFVEHLLFRGNKKFKTAKEWDEEKDKLGLSYLATTHYDHVSYSASFPPSEMERALELSAYTLFESLLKDEEIEKERQVMLEEEKLREDNVVNRAWDFTLQTRLKNRNHPLTLPREGLPQKIRALKPQTLRRFYRCFFQPANLTLVIGSNFEFGKLKKLVEKVFRKFSAGEKIPMPGFRKKDFSPSSIAAEKRDVEKTYLYFTFPAFSRDRPLKDRLAIGIISRILQRIRLDRRLYQERGLSYDWDSGWTIPTHPIAIFLLYSSCDPKNLPEIVKIFFEELKNLQTKIVTVEELKRARDYLNKIESMDFDTLSGAVGWFLGDFFYYGRFYSPEEVISARNSLTPEYLFKIAKRIINFKNINVTVLGPTSQKDLERKVGGIIK